MKNNNELLEAAIFGGLIGAALEALIQGNNKNTGLGLIAGAVISASLKANEEALKTNIPLILKENNTLYEVNSNGSKRIIRKLPRNYKHIPKKFTLK